MAGEDRPLVDQHGREPNESQSVAIQGWGKRIGLTGPNAFPWFVIMLLMIGIGYLIDFNLKNWGEPFPIKTTIANHQAVMNQDHGNFRASVDELTYVMSVCLNKKLDAECADIRLSMPDSLRMKTRRGRLDDER